MSEEIEAGKSPKLTIELVPKTSWFTNLRSILPREDWDMVRHATYKSADYHCEICGGRGEAHPVECHEIWGYDDDQHRQVLIGLIALCPDCHRVKHIGLAQVRGAYPEALQHLARVNGWSIREAETYVALAFRKWRDRNHFKWEVDISFIKATQNQESFL